jgi:hypothetical protein
MRIPKLLSAGCRILIFAHTGAIYFFAGAAVIPSVMYILLAALPGLAFVAAVYRSKFLSAISPVIPLTGSVFSPASGFKIWLLRAVEYDLPQLASSSVYRIDCGWHPATAKRENRNIPDKDILNIHSSLHTYSESGIK